MFKDRKDTGIRLAQALKKYRERDDVIVLAIPRGGIEVGAEIARYLHAPFDLVICRKLPYPFNPESGFGALCEDGTIYINKLALDDLSQSDITRAITQQEREIAHRIALLRGGRPLTDIHDKTVILVDDGIAMGSTMQAAITMLRASHPKKIIVAVPTASPEALEHFRHVADDVVALFTPSPFFAVADAYERWYDVGDEEALQILANLKNYVQNDENQKEQA